VKRSSEVGRPRSPAPSTALTASALPAVDAPTLGEGWPSSTRRQPDAGGRTPPPANNHRGRPTATIPGGVAVRRSRRVVRHVGLWSVFRFSVLLYVTFLIVAMVTGIGLWIAASDSGAIKSIEHFIDVTFLVKNFHFQSWPILLGGFGMGVVLVFVGTGVNLLVAAFYNLISDVVGGIEISVIEEEPGQRVV
jgi:hypothetical protein